MCRLTIGLLFSISLFLTSCDNNAENGVEINTKTATDKQTFVLKADADTIRPEWSTENIIINHVPGEPADLHPTNGRTASRNWIFQYTQNTLLRYDIINLKICPDLVKELPTMSENNTKYNYQLRTDIKWDDGSAITIEDVLFSFKAVKCQLINNPNVKDYVNNIQGIQIDAQDVTKFTIVMKKPYIQNVIMMTDIFILQKSFFDPLNSLANYTFENLDDSLFTATAGEDIKAWALQMNDANYGNDIALLVGSGAYKVVEWQRGQYITLQKKENHWTSKLTNPTPFETSFADKIIFKINKDENAQILEFKAQQIDVSAWMPTKSVMALQEDASFNQNYNVDYLDKYDASFIALNTKPDGVLHQKFFTDVKVRRAMAYLTPVDQMLQTLALGKGSRTATLISPLDRAYDSSLALIPLDVEAAKKLLEEAGWKDTDGDNIRDKIIDGEKVQMKIGFTYASGQQWVEDAVNMIKASMQLGGVDLQLQPIDFTLFTVTIRQHDFDMALASWSKTSLPEDYSQAWKSSNWSGGGDNYTGFGNAESDALIDSLKYELDIEKRIPMLKRFQRMVYDEQPYIFTYSTYRKIIIHKRFGNQYMTFERPGILLNHLRLLSKYGSQQKGEQPK